MLRLATAYKVCPGREVSPSAAADPAAPENLLTPETSRQHANREVRGGQGLVIAVIAGEDEAGPQWRLTLAVMRDLVITGWEVTQ